MVGMLTIIEALLPGLEAAAPGEATRDVARFDLVIVDTAPTGNRTSFLRQGGEIERHVSDRL